MNGCGYTWEAPSGVHRCMHVQGHDGRHEPYRGAPSFVVVGYIGPFRSWWEPRQWTGMPTETPPRGYRGPQTLQEASEDLEEAGRALRAVWEPPIIRVLDWMAKRLQAWDRALKRRNRR
jgi:hypothetical protein